MRGLIIFGAVQTVVTLVVVGFLVLRPASKTGGNGAHEQPASAEPKTRQPEAHSPVAAVERPAHEPHGQPPDEAPAPADERPAHAEADPTPSHGEPADEHAESTATHPEPAEAHAGAHRKAGSAADAPDAVLSELLAGNALYAKGTAGPRELIRARAALSKGQHPKAIILSCSDSRVPPELVFDQSLGDLFVVRVAGNVADKLALGSIEYAVEHLHAGLVIVLGHEKCGAVTAASTGEKVASPNLQALVDEISPGVLPLKRLARGETLISMGVEANARATADELVSRSAVIRQHVDGGKLLVVKAVYDLDSGRVRLLP